MCCLVLLTISWWCCSAFMNGVGFTWGRRLTICACLRRWTGFALCRYGSTRYYNCAYMISHLWMMLVDSVVISEIEYWYETTYWFTIKICDACFCSDNIKKKFLIEYDGWTCDSCSRTNENIYTYCLGVGFFPLNYISYWWTEKTWIAMIIFSNCRTTYLHQ